MKIFLGISSYNRKDLLFRCLESLKPSKHLINTLIVVDNGNQNIEHSDIDITLINKSNLGYCGGTNQILQLAKDHDADWCLILNDDITVVPDFMEKLAPLLELCKDKWLLTPDWEWACIAFSKEGIKNLEFTEGQWLDEQFWPGYYSDNDLHWRIKCTGRELEVYIGAVPELTPWIKEKSKTKELAPELNHVKSIPLYIRKWGGLPGQETVTSIEGKTQNTSLPVSIITPCSRDAAHIAVTIKCIQLQTMSNYEHILYYDGEIPNDIRALVKEVGDSRIVLVNTEKKYNDSGATPRNLAIAMARGEFCCFCDDDDIIAENWVELPFNVAQNNQNLDLVVSYMRCNDGRLVPAGSDRFPLDCWVGTPNLFVRTEFLLKKEIKWETTGTHDYAFARDIVNAGAKIGWTEPITTYYVRGYGAPQELLDKINDDSNQSVFSLLHASRGRPDKAAETAKLFVESLPKGIKFSYILSLDKDDAQLEQYLELFNSLWFKTIIAINDNNGPVEAFNAAAKLIKEDSIIIGVCDDIRPTLDWAEKLLNFIENNVSTKEFFIHISDGHAFRDDCATIAIMSFSLYNLLGNILHPSYTSHLADNDITETVKRLGFRYVCKDFELIHEHPDWGYGQFDDTYLRMRRNIKESEIIYEKRSKRNFNPNYRDKIV